MAFLKERRAKEAGKNVKDIMFKRRPDVEEIDLSCENTNTALPYIDLVNEILEDGIEPLQAYTIPAAVAPHLVEGRIKNELLTEVRNQGLQVSEEAVVSVIKEGEIWSIKDMYGYYKVHKLTLGGFSLKPSRLPVLMSFISIIVCESRKGRCNIQQFRPFYSVCGALLGQ
jgi:hypothetical protein